MKHGGMSPTKQHSHVAELVDALDGYSTKGKKAHSVWSL